MIEISETEESMKNIGAIAVVFGFLLWFGGAMESVHLALGFNMIPYNTIGIPILIIGAVLYFVGRRKKPQ